MIKPVLVKMSQVAFTPKLFGAEALWCACAKGVISSRSFTWMLELHRGVDGVRAEFDTRSFSVRSRCKLRFKVSTNVMMRMNELKQRCYFRRSSLKSE